MRVQKEEEDGGRAEDDNSLLDWPAFVRRHIPPTSLKVILHAVHADDWARANAKSQLTGRLLTLYVRFGLGARFEEPWLLFLYLGEKAPLNIRLVKTLNAWISANEHIEPTFIPAAITEQAILRHGRNDMSSYTIFDVDVERAMRALDQEHPPLDPRLGTVSAASLASRAAPASRQMHENGADERDPDRNAVHPEQQSIAVANNSQRGRRGARVASADGVDNPQANTPPPATMNRRKRPRRDDRSSSVSSAATPEVGRRTAQGTPVTSPLPVPDVTLSSLVSPNPFFPGGPHGPGGASRSDGGGVRILETRLEALRTVVALGPACEIDVESPLARQTRGLLDSIGHLSRLALDTIAEITEE
ncbi:hypothetical protein ACJ41O_006125 [Fusarium nematophilum]